MPNSWPRHSINQFSAAFVTVVLKGAPELLVLYARTSKPAKLLAVVAQVGRLSTDTSKSPCTNFQRKKPSSPAPAQSPRVSVMLKVFGKEAAFAPSVAPFPLPPGLPLRISPNPRYTPSQFGSPTMPLAT